MEALDLATQHDAAVGATLRLQWEALKSEAVRQVLQTTALLGEAEQVPRARLALLTGLSDRAAKGRPAPLGEALRAASHLSLVEELSEQEVQLHPLVREFVAGTIEERAAFAEVCVERMVEALWEMGRLHEEVAERGIDAVLTDLRAGAALAPKSRSARLIRPLDLARVYRGKGMIVSSRELMTWQIDTFSADLNALLRLSAGAKCMT